MNIIAHGLWGAALTPKNQFHKVKWTVFWSIFPDLVWVTPFIPFLLLTGFRIPLDFASAPIWFFHLYGFGHSLVVWAVMFVIGLLLKKKRVLPLLFWLFHILADIPGHTHFTTPFLYPFSTVMVTGFFSWTDLAPGTLSFLIPILLLWKRHKLIPRTP